ncbi:MAG: hypothetical protein Q4B81_03340, partial [Moraxella sp.]|nr:hypothetical protein [Moraxella sp.]
QEVQNFSRSQILHHDGNIAPATPAIIPNSEPNTADSAAHREQPPISASPAKMEQGNLPANKAALIQKLHAPQIELTGEWDAQKWDYWLFLARQEGIFDNDELALLHHSRMMGSIDGVSTLYVPSNNAQVDVSFATAKDKITQHFPNIQLNNELPPLSDDDKSSTPHILQKEREADVLIDAQNQLIQSPVVQQLWQGGFIQNDGSPIITSTKLTLDNPT